MVEEHRESETVAAWSARVHGTVPLLLVVQYCHTAPAQGRSWDRPRGYLQIYSKYAAHSRLLDPSVPTAMK